MKGIYFMFFSMLIVFFAIGNVKAQCSFTVTATAAESRCKNTGTITLTVSVPGTYTYQITAGPQVSGPTNNNVFSSLVAGTYTVTTTNGICTVTKTVIVPGNYVDPSVQTVAITHVSCPGGTGCITANQPTGGRLPYTYSIISGPVTRPVQSSPIFCGLPAGSYTLQSNDSCGFVRTATNLTVANDTGYFAFSSVGAIVSYGCDGLIFGLNGQWTNSSAKLIMKWYVAPNGDTIKANTSFESTTYPNNPAGNPDTVLGPAMADRFGTWKFLILDTCGRIFSYSYNYTKTIYAPTMLKNKQCMGYKHWIVRPPDWAGTTMTTIITKCSDNSVVYSSTVMNPPSVYYDSTSLLQYDTCYRLKTYNSCGDTLIGTFSQTYIKLGIILKDGPGCSVVGKGQIWAGAVYSSGTAPYTYIIVAGPERVGETVVQNPNSSYIYFANLTLGTYTVKVTDACGDTAIANVTLDEALIRNTIFTQTPNCSGGSDIHLKIESNFYNGYNLPYGWNSAKTMTYLTTSQPGITPVNITSTQQTGVGSLSTWEADFINIPQRPQQIFYYYNSYCLATDTIAVIGYSLPKLDSVKAYSCPDGTAILTPYYTGGKPSYQFRIRLAPSGAWSAWQTSNTFSGVTPGNTYDFEMRDACPNGAIKQVAVLPFTSQAIIPNPLCSSIGSTVVFRPQNIFSGITYMWYKDNVLLTSDTILTITNYQSTYNGTYKLVQLMPNNACKDSSTIVYRDCASLPITGLNLSAVYSNVVTLTWQTLTEQNTDKFVVEKSIDGVNFTAIANVNAAFTSNSLRKYNYIDNTPNGSLLYYRIRSVDIDGKVTYSNIAKVRTDGKKEITIYPNPAQQFVNISVSGIVGKLSADIYNVEGRLVMQKQIQQGVSSIDISSISKGIYLVVLKDFTTHEKVMIQKLIIQ